MFSRSANNDFSSGGTQSTPSNEEVNNSYSGWQISRSLSTTNSSQREKLESTDKSSRRTAVQGLSPKDSAKLYTDLAITAIRDATFGRDPYIKETGSAFLDLVNEISSTNVSPESMLLDLLPLYKCACICFIFIVTASISLLFFIVNMIEGLTTQFVSLKEEIFGAHCTIVPQNITGTYLISSDGSYQGNAGIKLLTYAFLS